MAASNISLEERNMRVSTLLRQVDEDVRGKHFEDALDKIRKVYEYDIKNIYARAYEERILVMMVERDREQAMLDVEKKAAERVDVEVKRRLKDFYRQQEIESEKKKQAEQREQALEDRARKASVSEVKQESGKDISAIELETSRRIEALEKRLVQQIQQQPSPDTANPAALEKIRAEYEAKFKQYESAEAERKKIQDEAFAKMKEEQQRSQEQLLQRMEEERNTLLEREREKEKRRSLDAYRSIMTLMMELAAPSGIQSSILQSLKISFSISDTEHMAVEREVQVRAYIETVRTLYQLPKQSEEDFAHLKNLRQLFHIADEEHASIVKRIKKELGLPDETAVIVAIDDDPAIRKYVDHILKRTYQTVIVAVSAESIIQDLQKLQPSLIISDVNLGVGVMSGFTFFEKIRSGEYGEKLKAIPLVLMSSMEDEFFIRSAKQLGVKEYLPKPFTREVLESIVKNALG